MKMLGKYHINHRWVRSPDGGQCCVKCKCSLGAEDYEFGMCGQCEQPVPDEYQPVFDDIVQDDVCPNGHRATSSIDREGYIWLECPVCGYSAEYGD